jgi:hypothetical protein
MNAAGGAGGGSSTGEFALTEPWVGGQDCSPESKDTCIDIPAENRATMIGGQNVMPTITWSAGPPGTQSYAMVFQDLSNGFAHWAMWNIPSDVTSIGPDAIPSGASQASFAGPDWFGSGDCDNVYELDVYALSEAMFTPGGQAQTVARDTLRDDDGSLVLAMSFARVNPKAPCGQ